MLGVSMVFHGCYLGVPWVLFGCFKGVFRMLQTVSRGKFIAIFNWVTRVIHEDSLGVLRMIVWCSNGVKGVRKLIKGEDQSKFYGNIKGVSRAFQKCRFVSRFFLQYYKDVGFMLVWYWSDVGLMLIWYRSDVGLILI